MCNYCLPWVIKLWCNPWVNGIPFETDIGGDVLVLFVASSLCSSCPHSSVCNVFSSSLAQQISWPWSSLLIVVVDSVTFTGVGVALVKRARGWTGVLRRTGVLCFGAYAVPPSVLTVNEETCSWTRSTTRTGVRGISQRLGGGMSSITLSWKRCTCCHTYDIICVSSSPSLVVLHIAYYFKCELQLTKLTLHMLALYPGLPITHDIIYRVHWKHGIGRTSLVSRPSYVFSFEIHGKAWVWGYIGRTGLGTRLAWGKLMRL